MFDRFTDRARKVMVLARDEAQRFSHEYIGTEHILLGLVREGSGTAANVLRNLGVDMNKIRREVERLVQHGPPMVTLGQLPSTPRAKKVFEFALAEASELGHNYIGTEHLLLGLIREQDGIAAQVLCNIGLKLEEVREEIMEYLGTEKENTAIQKNLEDKGLPIARLQQFLGVKKEILALEEEIARFDREKEESVAAQDFETAAHWREQSDAKKRALTVARQRLLVFDSLGGRWVGKDFVTKAGTICVRGDDLLFLRMQKERGLINNEQFATEVYEIAIRIAMTILE